MALKTLKEIERNGIRELVFSGGTFSYITGDAAKRQRLENRLRRWQGEFFDDPEQGIDWEDVFNSSVDVQRIEALIRAELEKDEIVREVLELSADLDRKARKINVTFDARGVENENIQGAI